MDQTGHYGHPSGGSGGVWMEGKQEWVEKDAA